MSSRIVRHGGREPGSEACASETCASVTCASVSPGTASPQSVSRARARAGKASWWRYAMVGLVACSGLVSGGIPAATGDVNPTGVWQVVDYFATDPATGAVTHPFGENPIGSAIYTAKGQMSVLVAGSHRVPSTGTGARRAEERAGLFDGLYAYTGTYTVKGDAVTIHVESAWQPDWVGTEKTRTLKLNHDLLSIVTAPMTSPVDGKTYISTTTFRRVE
jgi:Lipocalin-like domain